MTIKVGETWVRHIDHTRNGVVGEVKLVIGIEEGGKWLLVFDNDGERWPTSLCVPVHPPRDKKPPLKIGWKECAKWLAAHGCFLGPSYYPRENEWVLTWCGVQHHASTRIGVVIAVRAAMRRKEKGK